MPNNSPKSLKSASRKPKNAPKRPETPLDAAKPLNRPPTAQTTQKRQNLPIWALILLLIAVVGGSALFICAVAGLFGPQKVALSPEYYSSDSSLALSDGNFIELLTPDRLADLENQKKSFLVFVDQTDCINADRLRGFLSDYTSETGLKLYRLMFSDLKNTNLKGQVKYYPSVVVFSSGAPVAWLDATSDADADAYNSYDAFKVWLDQNLQLSR